MWMRLRLRLMKPNSDDADLGVVDFYDLIGDLLLRKFDEINLLIATFSP